VIDFVSVFCNGTKKSKTFIFRPYSQHFLQEMSRYFDIVVISDALPHQIDKIIDILDTKGVIQHRLYKYHMVEDRRTGKYMKNLERIGRDMSRTILLDVNDNRMGN
jgi:import inner membrane translocase subunit TIM50